MGGAIQSRSRSPGRPDSGRQRGCVMSAPARIGIFALFVALTGAVAVADPAPSGIYSNNSSPVPFGGGCSQIKMDGSTLEAVCLNFFGAEQIASLPNANECVAEKHQIENVNGFLRCVMSSLPIGGSNPYVGDIISIVSDVKNDSGETKVLRIDQPRVDIAQDQYSSIRFQPDDSITIDAGGCAQTGGWA
jgi:hypothetical protein